MTNIGTVFLNKILCEFVQAIKIITRIGDFDGLETQPLNHACDSSEIFLLFLGGVCIIISKITNASMILCKSEVDCDSFTVPQVKETIGFGWKAGDNLIAGFKP